MERALKEKLAGEKILFATLGADGHFNPLTGLAHYLKELNCDVRWYTTLFYKDKLTNLNIPHYPVVKGLKFYSTQTDENHTKIKQIKDEGQRLNLDEVFPERKLIQDLGQKLNFDLKVFANLAPGQCQDIADIYTDFSFDVIIADSCFPSIPLLKAKLPVPVLAVGVIPLAEESIDAAPYGSGLYPPATNEERESYSNMRNGFLNVVIKEAMDVYHAILSENNIAHEKSTMMDTLIKHTDLLLQIGVPAFEYPRTDLGANIRFIGALLPYSEEKENKPWFDDRLHQFQKVVLVTQGTVEGDTQKILVPTLEAFKNTDTLVIATTGGHGTEELRKKYSSPNIIIEDFIPFNTVMPYADVYVTNGGYGGTMLSLKNKLPVIAAGIHEGKSEICARIGYFKYGVNLQTETPTSEEIKKAVELVLSNPIYRQNIAWLGEELNMYHSLELSAQYILEVIEELNFVPVS